MRTAPTKCPLPSSLGKTKGVLASPDWLTSKLRADWPIALIWAPLLVLGDRTHGASASIQARSSVKTSIRRKPVRSMSRIYDRAFGALRGRLHHRKLRGRPENKRLGGLLALIREKCADFGPTLAAEKLRELHGVTIGRETLRIWMLDARLWADHIFQTAAGSGALADDPDTVALPGEADPSRVERGAKTVVIGLTDGPLLQFVGL